MPVELSKGHPIFDKAEAAKVSIKKAKVEDVSAAVYMACDFSSSMSGHYSNGTMQDLTERVLGLSARFDDDGKVPVFLFDTSVRKPVEVDVNNPHGAMADIVRKAGRMGGTNYAPAIKAIREYHRKNGNGAPGFVIFQTDGDTYPASDTEREIRDAEKDPMFWQFVGYGAEEKAFLNKLNKMERSYIDNAGYFPAGLDPRTLDDVALYDGLLNEFPSWVREFQAKAGGFAPRRRRGLFG